MWIMKVMSSVEALFGLLMALLWAIYLVAWMSQIKGLLAAAVRALTDLSKQVYHIDCAINRATVTTTQPLAIPPSSAMPKAHAIPANRGPNRRTSVDLIPVTPVSAEDPLICPKCHKDVSAIVFNANETQDLACPHCNAWLSLVID